MTAYPVLAQDAFFIAVPIWQRWASKVSSHRCS